MIVAILTDRYQQYKIVQNVAVLIFDLLNI